MCQMGAKNNPWASYRVSLSTSPYVTPNLLNRGLKSTPTKFQPTGWMLTSMSIKHILGYIDWL